MAEEENEVTGYTIYFICLKCCREKSIMARLCQPKLKRILVLQFRHITMTEEKNRSGRLHKIFDMLKVMLREKTKSSKKTTVNANVATDSVKRRKHSESI